MNPLDDLLEIQYIVPDWSCIKYPIEPKPAYQNDHRYKMPKKTVDTPAD